MSKHTPGPWTISMGKAEESKDNTTWVLMAPSDDPAFAGTGEPVVVLSFASREDARLIAAAPECLAELKKIVTQAEINPFLAIGMLVEHHSKIKAAIAKAEGKE